MGDVVTYTDAEEFARAWLDAATTFLVGVPYLWVTDSGGADVVHFDHAGTSHVLDNDAFRTAESIRTTEEYKRAEREVVL